MNSSNLYLHLRRTRHARTERILVLGEILWDIFPDSVRLGGDALNFAAHARRLQHEALLISAVGRDELGEQAMQAVTDLGLDKRFIQTTALFSTGTANVQFGPSHQTSFSIERPAAYDAVGLSEPDFQQVIRWKPAWLYYGTLFSSIVSGKDLLNRLLQAVPGAKRFYDVNLRPGSNSAALV